MTASLYTHVARYCDPQAACEVHSARPRLHRIPRPEPVKPALPHRPGRRHAPGAVVALMSIEARMAAYRRQNGRLQLTARQYRQIFRQGRAAK